MEEVGCMAEGINGEGSITGISFAPTLKSLWQWGVMVAEMPATWDQATTIANKKFHGHSSE